MKENLRGLGYHVIAELVHLVRNQLNYKTLEAATYTFLTSLHDDTLARLGPEQVIRYTSTLVVRFPKCKMSLPLYIDSESFTIYAQKLFFLVSFRECSDNRFNYQLEVVEIFYLPCAN